MIFAPPSRPLPVRGCLVMVAFLFAVTQRVNTVAFGFNSSVQKRSSVPARPGPVVLSVLLFFGFSVVIIVFFVWVNLGMSSLDSCQQELLLGAGLFPGSSDFLCLTVSLMTTTSFVSGQRVGSQQMGRPLEDGGYSVGSVLESAGLSR